MLLLNKTVRKVVFRRYVKIQPRHSNASLELRKIAKKHNDIASHTISTLVCNWTTNWSAKADDIATLTNKLQQMPYEGNGGRSDAVSTRWLPWKKVRKHNFLSSENE